MSKLGSRIKRVVKRLAQIEPARKQGEHPELVPVEGRSHGEPREPLELETLEGRTHGEPREYSELVPAEGRYYGEQRVPTDFMPAERRYRGGPQSNLDLTHEETPEYIAYWRAIMLRKWSILALAMLVAVIASVAVSQMVPVYRSSATVLIEIDRTKLVPIGDVYTGIGSYYREYFQTQAEVLRSREVAQRVVTKLKLAEHPEFDPRQTKPSALETWMGEHVPELKALFLRSPGVLDEASVEDEALKRYAGRLSVEPVRQSQLIKVSFDAHDASLAAAVANATAQAYIQADLDARSTINQNAGQQINERLAELKATLNASEKALQAYRDREGMLDNKSTVLGGTATQLDGLIQKLVDARVRRSEAEEAYNQVKAGEATNYESVPAVVKSSSVQRAKEVEAEAEKKLAEVSQRYGPDHPKFVAGSSDLSAARANTRRQIQNLVASVVKEYEAARATEKAIQGALAQSKATIQNLNRKEIQLGMLEREAVTNRQLYQTFLSRFKETSATKDAQGSNARVVDAAVPALSPIRPAKTRTVTIATGVSLLFGVIGAVLLYRFNNTLQTSDDVENKLHRPLLAALPILPRRNKKNRGQAVLDQPHDLYAESIRVASTEVLLSALKTPRKIVTITSCVLDEGKSTFAINFAYSQAKTKRVLLIEGDMRRPCFDKAMILAAGQKGLSELLSGAGTLEECLLQVDGTDLHVIAAGHIPPNPQELLVSRKFSDVLTTLRARYDMIIIDSPPVQLVSDALVIGAQSTGLIFIVKADDTPVPLAKKALKRIASANIPIFGVVLNQQDYKKAEKYYGEYSGYGKDWYGAEYGVKR
jgi:capsular exopolysaccharide synthesis family protein